MTDAKTPFHRLHRRKGVAFLRHKRAERKPLVHTTLHDSVLIFDFDGDETVVLRQFLYNSINCPSHGPYRRRGIWRPDLTGHFLVSFVFLLNLCGVEIMTDLLLERKVDRLGQAGVDTIHFYASM